MREAFLELVRRAATDFPADVARALGKGRDAEAPGSAARELMDELLANCALARESFRPLCQDTGTNIWYVFHPRGTSTAALAHEILEATRQATARSFLRPNAVDSVTGKNSGDNTGLGAPIIHFREWEKKEIVADLMLKGGGSENVSAQYSLPDESIGAGRDLEGVRRAVIDAAFRAQGQGCAPGIVGVGIGGDRATGMIAAKEQLFRSLDDTNPDPLLATLESRLLGELNQLGVGPMGYGGKTTALGVKIGARHRVPASFFVSIAYMCWALRRASVTISGGKAAFSQACQVGHGGHP